MTTRNGRSMWRVCVILCLLTFLAPAAVRGDGSIEFNLNTLGTSKLQHDSAWLVQGKEVTICAWLYADGQGEGNEGVAVALDENGNRMRLRHNNANGVLKFVAEWDTQDGGWTFSAADNAWNAVAVTYDGTDDTNDPSTWVNFSKVTATEEQMPDGSHVMSGTGYCVGNIADASRTWDGKIAHVQVFNRILSPSEIEACLRAPGSVKHGLKLWLPMRYATDVADRSGNGFNGTGTDVTTGSDGPIVSSQQGVPPGVVLLPPGTHSVNQYVIPRYADGANHPAGQLRGAGPMSVVAGTQQTDNQSTPAVIITEGIAEDLAGWQNGSTSHEDPAVLQPVLADCTVIGYSPDAWASEGDVNADPHIWNQGDPVLYNGYRAYGNAGIVDNVSFLGIPGTCIIVSRPTEAGRIGFQRPFDRLKWNLSRISCRRVFRGIENQAVDSHIHDVEVESFRDWGIKLGSAVQFARLHTYGGGFAAETDTNGAGIWLAGDTAQGGPIYPESSVQGLLISGNYNTVDGVYSHTCSMRNMWVYGQYNQISNFRVDCSSIGCEVANQFNTISHGTFICSGTATAVKIASGTRHSLDNIIINAYSASSATGIVVADNTTLSNCRIVAHQVGGAKGFDCDGSGVAIGSGNYIVFTTSHSCADPYDLPANVTTTVNTADTNFILIDGVRYYKQP